MFTLLAQEDYEKKLRNGDFSYEGDYLRYIRYI